MTDRKSTRQLQSRPHLVCRLLLEKKNSLRSWSSCSVLQDPHSLATAIATGAATKRNARPPVYLKLTSVLASVLLPCCWEEGHCSENGYGVGPKAPWSKATSVLALSSAAQAEPSAP